MTVPQWQKLECTEQRGARDEARTPMNTDCLGGNIAIQVSPVKHNVPRFAKNR
jgi:hypothetical protein